MLKALKIATVYLQWPSYDKWAGGDEFALLPCVFLDVLLKKIVLFFQFPQFFPLAKACLR